MIFIEQQYSMANSTCVKWSKFCKEVAVDQVFEQSKTIGGPGIIVDESKFGKSNSKCSLSAFSISTNLINFCCRKISQRKIC